MLHTETIEEWECGKFRLKLTATDLQECPNDAYGNWEQAPCHIGGETVTLPGSDCYHQSANTFWRNANYTPAQLAKEFAAQGRENPSREAYKSLQNELRSDLLGGMYAIELTVYVGAMKLASDSIVTQWSEWDGESLADRAKEAHSEYLDAIALCVEAQIEVMELAQAVA